MADSTTYVTGQKIKLFVSSGMSANSLKSIRTKIHNLLMDSPYISGWLFEHAGASTFAAETDYRMRVADADVCAFIIDGRCEIPEGVQNELDEASRRNKKCFYYLYKVSHDGPRKLRDGLRGPDKSHYCEVNKIRDIPQQLQRDVVEEVFFLYRSYAAGDVALSLDGDATSLSPLPDDTFVNRSGLVGFSACNTLMSNYLYGREDTPESDDDLDKAASAFLEALYIKAAPHELRLSPLLSALECCLPERYYPTIALRWRAVFQYYLGDLPEALSFEKQAFETARDSGLPAWFVDDILIDLRNLETEADRERGIIWRPDSYQEIIEKRNRSIQLPLVDRMTTNLLESMLAEELKGRVQSAYVITLGSPSSKWVDMLVKLFVATVHYGSLTHLQLLARRMRLVASYIWRATGDRATLIAELKLALVTDTEKSVQGFLMANSQLLGNLTYEEADSAFRFAWGAAAGYRRDETRISALAVLGPFLSDDVFSKAMAYARECCEELFDKAPMPPSSLTHMLTQCWPRDMSSWMIDLAIDALDVGPNTHWAHEALQFLSGGSINRENLNSEHVDALLAAIGRQVTSGKANESELIRAISGISTLPIRQAEWFESFAENLPSTQKTNLVLALDEVDEEFVCGLLEESLRKIRSDNATQGVGGKWSRGINHYRRTEALIEAHPNSASNLLCGFAIACVETLLAPTQSTDAKWDACLLLLFLLGKDISLLKDKVLTNRLRSLDDTGFSGVPLIPIASYNEDNARIACIAVRESYGVAEVGSLRLALLEKHWGKPGELGRLATLLGYLVSEPLWKVAGDDAIQCSVEFLLSLIAHESNEVRRAAISAVSPVTKHPVFARTTCASLTRVFASSHPGSKHTILNAVKEGGAFTSEERSLIIRSASNSSCYYVRRRIIGEKIR